MDDRERFLISGALEELDRHDIRLQALEAENRTLRKSHRRATAVTLILGIITLDLHYIIWLLHR